MRDGWRDAPWFSRTGWKLRVSADRELWVYELERPGHWQWCVVSTLNVLDHDYRSGIEDTAEQAQAAAVEGWHKGPLAGRWV